MQAEFIQIRIDLKPVVLEIIDVFKKYDTKSEDADLILNIIKEIKAEFAKGLHGN